MLNILENVAQQLGPCRRKDTSFPPFIDGLAFRAKHYYIPVENPKEEEVDENMIQQRDLQVTEFVIAPQATAGQV